MVLHPFFRFSIFLAILAFCLNFWMSAFAPFLRPL